jgi:hypothetical protein
MTDVLYGDETTLLRIAGVGISPYSARGLTQTLELIQAAVGNQKRTINGDFVDWSVPQFRKFHSTISCTDQNAPAFDGIWPGMELVVDCIVSLSYKAVGGSPIRVIVPGSERIDGDFVIYRPRLTMLVLNFNSTEDEWDAQVGWQLELEEK